MRRILIFGATSGIAQGCLHVWAEEEPSEFVLVGRNAQELDRIAADLKVRSPASVTQTLVGAFAGAAEIEQTVVTAVGDGAIDIAVVAFGTLPAQETLAGDAAALAEVLEVNGVWPAVFAQLLFDRQREAHRGQLVLLGSVAGDRGRRSNYAYGAGKSLLATFGRGLQHAAPGTGVTVTIVKPGPTDTPMARGVETAGKLAPVPVVAADIVRASAAGKAIVYTPRIWRLIMVVIRSLPDAIFNRLNI